MSFSVVAHFVAPVSLCAVRSSDAVKQSFLAARRFEPSGDGCLQNCPFSVEDEIAADWRPVFDFKVFSADHSRCQYGLNPGAATGPLENATN